MLNCLCLIYKISCKISGQNFNGKWIIIAWSYKLKKKINFILKSTLTR